MDAALAALVPAYSFVFPASASRFLAFTLIKSDIIPVLNAIADISV